MNHARASNRSLPWESGAEDARTPNADASSADLAGAKRLECVRFIGAFRPTRDGQRFMATMHDFGTVEAFHESPIPSGYHFAWKYGFVDFQALARLLPG